MRASAAVVAERPRGFGPTRLTRLRSSPPLALRAAAGSVWLVGTAAGPLGGDRLQLRVEVGAGACLTVRSTAAMVVLGAREGEESVLDVDVDVGPGGRLAWLPEAAVATAGCRHRSTAAVRLARGATLVWREELVAGRCGEGPGRYRSRLDVEVEGRPLLRQEMAVGDDAPGWAGPAVLGGAGAAGIVAAIGPPLGATPPPPPTVAGWRRPGAGPADGDRAAVLALGAGGVLVSAAADDAVALRRLLDGGLELSRSAPSRGPGRGAAGGAEAGPDPR